MRLKETLESLSAPQAQGPQPGFQSFQLLDALLTIDREAPIGRKKLSRRLGVGEGTIRTMLQRLKAASLLEVRGKGGCALSRKGKRLVSELRRRLVDAGPLSLSLPWEYPENYAVMVRGAVSRVRRGIEQRDEAIKAGAKALLVLSYHGGRLLMPGVADLTAEKPEFASKLIGELKPQEGDVILIAGASTHGEARRGALAAAQTLI